MPENSQLRTNRDLYLFVADLCARNTGTRRTLEDYLKVLWLVGGSHRELAGLPLSSFADLLEAGFHRDPPPFDPHWLARDERADHEVTGYRRWEHRIVSQIVDLHEMK